MRRTYAVPGSGAHAVPAANANLSPWTEAKVETPKATRGPLCSSSTSELAHIRCVGHRPCHLFPTRQKRNPGVTEIVKIPGRGHSLTIDHGWREVADTALTFVQKHAQR